MHRSSCFLLLAAAIRVLSGPRLRAADDVTFASLLGEMVDRAVLTHPPLHAYSIEGSLSLAAFNMPVIEAPIRLSPTATELPDLSGSGWEYHTFILQNSDGLPGSGFLRARITQP